MTVVEQPRPPHCISCNGSSPCWRKNLQGGPTRFDPEKKWNSIFAFSGTFLWGCSVLLFAASMVDQWNEDDRSLPTRWLHLLHSNDPKMWPQTKTLVEWRQWTRFLIKGLFFVDFVFTKCRFFVDFKNILLIFCIYPLLLRSTPFSFIAWKWHNFHAKQSVKMFLFLLHLGATSQLWTLHAVVFPFPPHLVVETNEPLYAMHWNFNSVVLWQYLKSDWSRICLESEGTDLWFCTLW